MTLDEYMEVLKQRSDEWLAAQPDPGPRLRFPPLLEWFVRDGDDAMVELPAAREPQRKPSPSPRHYRPASHWRERIANLEARMQAVSEPLITDRAAAGGVALGVKRTARIQAREDHRLQQYVVMRKRLEHAQRMLRSAEARGAKSH